MIPDPAKQAEFQRREPSLRASLFEEITVCVPRDWTLAVLELTAESTGLAGVTMHHALRNPANWQAIAKLPRSLMLAAGHVHSLYHEFGHSWVRATFTVIFDRPDRPGARRIHSTEAHFDYTPLPPRPPASGKPAGLN